jgi:hypothetical protein
MTGNPECQIAECLLPGVALAATEALAGWGPAGAVPGLSWRWGGRDGG